MKLTFVTFGSTLLTHRNKNYKFTVLNQRLREQIYRAQARRPVGTMEDTICRRIGQHRLCRGNRCRPTSPHARRRWLGATGRTRHRGTAETSIGVSASGRRSDYCFGSGSGRVRQCGEKAVGGAWPCGAIGGKETSAARVGTGGRINFSRVRKNAE